MVVGKLGYYLPFGVLGGAITAVACGLISTWDPDTSTAEWVGYQILFGLRGMALQIVNFPLNLPTISPGVLFTPTVSSFTNREKSTYYRLLFQCNTLSHQPRAQLRLLS